MDGEGASTFVQTLRHAPYPYSGKYEDTTIDFFDFVDPVSGERFHTNRLGERFSEKDHYSDSRALFHVPPHFDPSKPFAYVLYFHGLRTDISKSNRDHQLTRQIDASGRNVILIVPQLAQNAADSSPGKLFRKNHFRLFMREAGRVLSAKMGQRYGKKLDTAPVILTAFSGGYKTLAYVLDRGGVNERVMGVFLMDALYEDVDKFEKWILASHGKSFFVSLYRMGSCEENMKELLTRIARRGIHAKEGWPDVLSRGSIYHARIETDHLDVPLLGPPKDPLACLVKLGTVLEPSRRSKK